MSHRSWAGVVAIVLVSTPSLAQSHRGSLGVTLGGGFEALTAVTSDARGESGFRVPGEVGVTLGLFNRTELMLSGRLSAPIGPLTGPGLSFYGGIRNSIGFEEWKTFFDIELAGHALPLFTLGLRIGFGVQYDFSPVAGVFAVLGAQLGGGVALRLSGEVTVGLQFRTYLFE